MDFAQRVKQIVKSVPKGRVLTYKLVAQKAGNPKAARAVGIILNRAFKNNEKLPCFRVVNSDGRVGGYALGQRKKIERLKAEKIEICNKRIIDLNKYLP